MSPKSCGGMLGLIGLVALLSAGADRQRHQQQQILVGNIFFADALPWHRPVAVPTFARRRNGFKVTCELRGGGNSKQETYIKLLREDNLRLEQGIRVYQERVERFREAENAAHQASLALRAQGGTRRELQEYKKLCKNLQKQVTSLEVSLRQITDLKQQVEELLQAELGKVKQLEQMIADAQLESEERQIAFQIELEALRKKMEDDTARQLQSLQTKLEKQAQLALNDAVKHAQTDAAKQYQVELKREIQQLQREHQTELQTLKADYERRIAEMKIQHEQEVEEERQRRKKLLKSLTTREKQVALENLQWEQAQRAAAKKKKQHSAESVRTPIK